MAVEPVVFDPGAIVNKRGPGKARACEGGQDSMVGSGTLPGPFFGGRMHELSSNREVPNAGLVIPLTFDGEWGNPKGPGKTRARS